MTIVDGILDRLETPATLTAHVVDPRPDPRVHGYAVQADLARNIGVADLGWLALTGELPDEREREALGRALWWLAPLHVGEAPVHAGVLARISGAPDEVVPAVVTVALGQHIAAELRALAPMFAWLSGQVDEPPAVAVLGPDAAPAERDAWAALVADSVRWFGRERAFPAAPALTRVAAAYAILARLGVGDPARLHAFATWARLPLALAEAACTAPGAVLRYPHDLPAYRYYEDE